MYDTGFTMLWVQMKEKERAANKMDLAYVSPLLNAMVA